MVVRMVVAAAVLLGLAILAMPAPARADGEAGLVIQHGDGTLDTFCLAFAGDGLTGAEMLRRAGVPFEDVSGLVCAVGDVADEGCRGAASFDACTCRCRAGGDGCVYWSYFTRPYGGDWQYSVIGFTALVAGDGDVQAWRWGPGGAASAPAPVDVGFEDVCGHAPTPGRLITMPTASPADETPVAAAAGGRGEERSGSVTAFLAVAAGLVGAVAAGLLWRRRRGG